MVLMNDDYLCSDDENSGSGDSDFENIRESVSIIIHNYVKRWVYANKECTLNMAIMVP